MVRGWPARAAAVRADTMATGVEITSAQGEAASVAGSTRNHCSSSTASRGTDCNSASASGLSSSAIATMSGGSCTTQMIEASLRSSLQYWHSS